MVVRRSNPWPALADLFAALLVITFAGLIVIDIGGQGASSREGAETLEQSVVNLSEELADVRERWEATREELVRVTDERTGLMAKEEDLLQQKASLEGELARLQKDGAQDQERLDYFERQVNNRGIDPPPCMLVDGRPQPLVEITVNPGGKLDVALLALGRFAKLADEIPGYMRLKTRVPIAPEGLAGIADPVYRWGMSGANAGGFSCVFYAHIAIETGSKGELATSLTYINSFFFTQNPSDVRAFLQRSGD